MIGIMECHPLLTTMSVATIMAMMAPKARKIPEMTVRASGM